jgi:MscS family membrane protein
MRPWIPTRGRGKGLRQGRELSRRKAPPEQAQELAQQLKYLLDQGLSTSIDDLSRSPTGNINDQQRLSRDSVGIVKTPGGDLKVMLDQVERPGHPSIWLFSQETLLPQFFR